jgi:hypothetical protein
MIGSWGVVLPQVFMKTFQICHFETGVYKTIVSADMPIFKEIILKLNVFSELSSDSRFGLATFRAKRLLYVPPALTY